ncbi:hypothetical protein [Lysinibacillus sp. NPDC096212]|uniref:hypothetical protein n=1 Tax=Lysinibacillus sp. NPDC096212 TaxID=3364135 RepID=UPI0038037349
MKKLFYIGAMSVLLLSACGVDKAEDTDSAQEESAKEKEKEAEQAKKEDKAKSKEEKKNANNNDDLADKAKKIITDKLGKKNNQKKDTVKSYAVTNEDNGKGFIIELNANENFSVNMTKKGMWMDSKKILEPLSKMNNFEKIIVHWYYPLVDTYGNEKDVLVMSFDIDKTTLNKIKWDNFLTDNVPNVVNNYFEHPALKN